MHTCMHQMAMPNDIILAVQNPGQVATGQLMTDDSYQPFSGCFFYISPTMDIDLPYDSVKNPVLSHLVTTSILDWLH